MGLIRRVWNAFTERDPPNDRTKTIPAYSGSMGYVSSDDPDRFIPMRYIKERTIFEAIKNRIALDAASLKYVHCKVDEDDQYLETVKDSLNDLFNYQANIDQSSKQILHNFFYTMLDTGCVALVITDASDNPSFTESYNIIKMRVGTVTEWFPQSVRVNVFNEKRGTRENIIVPKSTTVIVQNPFREIMNTPNSIATRLNDKLSLLDYIDRNTGSGKLNLLFQLPYEARTDKKKQRIKNRKKEIEQDLVDNKYGIAYIDSTEKVIQLNRAIDNGLFDQVEYYTKLLFTHLGMTEAILNGTASEQEMTNYYSNIINIIADAFVSEVKRKWISKTAISRGHSFKAFRDMFKLATLSTIATVGQSMVNAEIITSNEVRSMGFGLRPSSEQQADQLANPNINPIRDRVDSDDGSEDYENELAQLDDLDAQLDALEKELGNGG